MSIAHGRGHNPCNKTPQEVFKDLQPHRDS